MLARSTHGFSGADITEVCTTASKLAIREAILEAEERNKRIEAGEIEEDEVPEEAGSKMLINKRHFNFAMSRARRSVTEKDLAQYDEFAEKQKAGRGDTANNFKFGETSVAEEEADDL